VNRVRRLGGAQLDADALLAGARRRTGLHDLGDFPGELPLRVLVGSLRDEARLTPFGRVLTARILSRYMVQRLRIVEELRRRPETAAVPIRRPLFVVGLPRTGTTLLLNLLAQVPPARPLRGWEAADPLPRRGREREFALLTRGLHYLAPELPRIHELPVRGATECFPLLNRSFLSWAYLLLGHVPSYERWLWEQDTDALEGSYRLHRAQLRLLSLQRAAGHWVLKWPAHVYALEALTRVYPDAAIVQTHRELAEVLPSNASLLYTTRSIFSDAVTRRATGRALLEQIERHLGRVVAGRDRLGDRVLDVRYPDLLADPLGVVRRIHTHFSYELPDGTEARITAYLAANPKGKHGGHRYSLEEFGLDRADVERVGAGYSERFGALLRA
jgi:hypothetical protein